jgi:hypothetical protein
VDAWRAEDVDFINENAAAHTTLIAAGCHYNRKPATVIGGILPPGLSNLYLYTGRQKVATNDAQSTGFEPNQVFEC